MQDHRLGCNSGTEMHKLELVDCPHHGKKNVVDDAIISKPPTLARGSIVLKIGAVEMTVTSMIYPTVMQLLSKTPGTPTLVLISGDSDFTEVVWKLRSKGHPVILIAPGDGRTSPRLRAAASKVLDWREVVERVLPSQPPNPYRNRSFITLRDYGKPRDDSDQSSSRVPEHSAYPSPTYYPTRPSDPTTRLIDRSRS